MKAKVEKNIAVIFAGGSGRRMHTKDKPKQFLLVHGKPIIVHTIEQFENHPEIDGIVVVCIEGWIDYMNDMIYRYRLDKVKSVVPGGKTGQLSIYNGLCAAEEAFGTDGTVVLIHDGVRPLIDADTISRNITAVREFGSAITCTVAKETVILVDDTEKVDAVPDRSRSRFAKAPQSFYLKDILAAHRQCLAEGRDNVIDSCTMMRMYGKPLHVVIGRSDNIKITTPDDFYIFRALYDARENNQIGEYE